MAGAQSEVLTPADLVELIAALGTGGQGGARPPREARPAAPAPPLPRRSGRRTPPPRAARLLQRLEPRAVGGEIRDAGEHREDLVAAQPAADSGVPRVMIENPDKEVLAAEYVLGTLGLAERVQVQQMIASDATFASLVRDWERRLDRKSTRLNSSH